MRHQVSIVDNLLFKNNLKLRNEQVLQNAKKSKNPWLLKETQEWSICNHEMESNINDNKEKIIYQLGNECAFKKTRTDELEKGKMQKYFNRLKCFPKIPRVLFFYDSV